MEILIRFFYFRACVLFAITSHDILTQMPSQTPIHIQSSHKKNSSPTHYLASTTTNPQRPAYRPPTRHETPNSRPHLCPSVFIRGSFPLPAVGLTNLNPRKTMDRRHC